MGFLQIGKRRSTKKTSSEQHLMIRSSSKKSSSSACTYYSSSPGAASPVNNDDLSYDSSIVVPKRKSGLFRSSFLVPQRRATTTLSSSASASSSSSSSRLLKTQRASKWNSLRLVPSVPDFHDATTNATTSAKATAADNNNNNNNSNNDHYKIAPVEEQEDPTTPVRKRVSVLSTLRVLPAGAAASPTVTSAADDTSATTTYQLNFDDVEVREEDSDAHYSPSPRRTLRYDEGDDDDAYHDGNYHVARQLQHQEEEYIHLANGVINDESFEIIMSELDTPVMDNRAQQQQQQQQQQQLLTPTGTTVTTTTTPTTAKSIMEEEPATHLLGATNDDANYDDDDEPFDAKEEARRFQQLSEDPTISDLEATDKEFSPPRPDSASTPLVKQPPQPTLQPQEAIDANLVTPDTMDDAAADASHNKAPPLSLNDNADATAVAAAAAAASKSQDDEAPGYYKTLLLETPNAASSVRRRLIDVFNCVSPEDAMSVVSATGTTVPYQHASPPRKIPMMEFFYDTVCGVPDVTKMTKKRPFYNEQFALDFLRKMIFEGFPLLYLQPSLDNENKDDDWTGESVTMKITPGVLAASLQLPRLEWSTWGGGWSHPEVRSTSLDLLQIHSVLDHKSVINAPGANYDHSLLDQSLEGEETARDQEGDVYAFTITSEQGDVYIFEASSENERDQVVCGLKNIMARLSYQLISGDEIMASELFQNPSKSEQPHDGSNAELPPLVTSRQAVQDMTHDLLDW